MNHKDEQHLIKVHGEAWNLVNKTKIKKIQEDHEYQRMLFEMGIKHYVG